MTDSRTRSGFTLIELVITIMVLAIGVTAFTRLMNASTIASVDPMIRQQAHAIAQSYLEEVMLNSFCDPNLSTDCPAFCTTANICITCGGVASPGSETRPDYDDVCDYNGLSNTNGARNQYDTVIAALSDYNVSVTVDDSAVTLSGLSSSSGQVVRVDVRVTHDTNPVDVTLSSYRTNF